MDEYERNLRSIVTTLRHINPAVIIVFWSTAPVQQDTPRNEQIARYNACMKRIAEDMGCAFVNSAHVLAAEVTERRYVDGVHLSSLSFRLLAEAVVEQVVPLLAGSPQRRDLRAAA